MLPEQEDDRKSKDGGKSKKRRSNVLSGFLGGLLGGVIITVGSQYLIVDQRLVDSATVSVDTSNFLQGSGSVQENFTLQPARYFRFNPDSETVGGFVHFQILPDPQRSIHGMDWRKYFAVKFFAMASAQGLVVTEVNLFTGPGYVQYMLRSKRPLVLGTRWQEFTIPLSGFTLAPWEPRTSENKAIDLANVTAFGLDEKTAETPLAGSIWLDYVRLVDHEGRQTLLSNCGQLEFRFQGHRVRWIAGGRQYG